MKGDILKVLDALGIEAKSNESMHSTQSGYGDEFVPTEMAQNIIDVARAEDTLLSKIPTQNIWDMPSNPFTVPVAGADPTFYLTDEQTDVAGTDVTKSKSGTALMTLTAKKISASVYITGELEEDANVAGGIRSYVERQLGEKFSEVIDSLIINGDTETGSTGNINSDNAARTAGTFDLAFDGLRKHAFAGTGMTADVGTLASSDFLDIRGLLAARYNANPKKLLVIMNPETYMKTLALAQVETSEKISSATIENGVLKAIYGMEIHVAPDFGLTEADGKMNTTASNNTKGGFLVVYKPAMHFGWKRKMKLNVEYLPRVDQYCITAHSRLAFDMDRADMVGLGYNATV